MNEEMILRVLDDFAVSLRAGWKDGSNGSALGVNLRLRRIETALLELAEAMTP